MSQDIMTTMMVDMLRSFVSQLYKQAGNRPIHVSRLIVFLTEASIPKDQVLPLLEIAENTNKIQRTAGTDTYVPVFNVGGES